MKTNKFVKVTYRFYPDQPKRLAKAAKRLSKSIGKYISANELLRDMLDKTL